MVDPIPIGVAIGVLGLLYSLSEEWREASKVVISRGDDVNEPAYQKAEAEGHKVRWVAERNLRSRHRDGWKPLAERDKTGRPTIFVDARKKLLLMYRRSDK